MIPVKIQCGCGQRYAFEVEPVEGRGATLLPGQVDRTQAEHEARAKVLWGDPPQVVTAYLITQGFSRPEAASLVEGLFQERAATIRGNGIKKIVLGIAMMFVPVVAVFIFLSVGLIHWGIFAATIIAGFWGVWTVFGGIRMVVTPKAVEGDAAE